MTRLRITLGLALIATAGAAVGCLNGPKPPAGQGEQRPGDLDARVRLKYGKGIRELPEATLVLISPHNMDIQEEFERAFRLHYALEAGKNVAVEWREWDGAVMGDLRNVYSKGTASEVDALWGGGDYIFRQLAREGLLQRLDLPPDVLASFPAELGGVELVDKDRRWCGTALSAFGFLYNRAMLQERKLAAPAQWQDLAGAGFHGQVALGDPTQSGSAAAANEMIVQSAGDWPAGWARLLDILGNCGRFPDSAAGAAEAPGQGQAMAAVCIDFYGITRVAGAPDKLFYVSPKGQTAHSPDGIAILKNPPHPDLAKAFVRFVLSRRGQALWALPPGQPDGPVRKMLGRLPIRRDVYEAYKGKLAPAIESPYQAGAAFTMDAAMQSVRFGVLRQLVRAAGVDNLADLGKAKKRLIELHFPADRLADFHKLPDNVDTPDDVRAVAKLLKDPKAHRPEIDRIVAGWTDFFRAKYRRVAR